MADIFPKNKRSQIMASVKGKDTKPEILVRSILHRLGYRFRLHSKKLPGHPDIVLPKHKKIIFVHGCFWHSHEGCNRASLPQTNIIFWEEKISSNIVRDHKNIELLINSGWRVKVIWECETKNKAKVTSTIADFMQS